MPRYPILQPNGRYAVFSTVVADFVEFNLTAPEVVELFTEAYRECLETILILHGEERANKALEQLTRKQ
jgi:hypothetical protein